MNAVLQRATFETSRALEYFSEKELQAQIGYDQPFWPVAILKELVDNALDACEEAGMAPEIEITMEGDSFTVTDNGPGIPAKVIERSLDYLVRVTNKAYYVSPTRGQLGNALKVIWAAPFVATGSGTIEVMSQGDHHIIEIVVDRIAQKPVINHTVTPTDVKSGTTVKIRWTDSARLLRGEIRDSYKPPMARSLIGWFTAFNPHATFIIDDKRYERTLETFEKWAPNQPTSAHWYTAENFRDLIAAYISVERAGGSRKTVRELVAEFRGLSSTVKQKAVTEGWSGKHLTDFIIDGDVDKAFVTDLLKRMQDASKPPPAKALGSIGKDHWTEWMVSRGVSEGSIKYSRQMGVDGLPYVLEVAFGVLAKEGRRIVAGLNWSPVIGSDPEPTLREVIAEARLDPHDPVMLLVHIARPRFQFVDRGKTRVAL